MPSPKHFCRPDALPVAQPTVSKHWREKYHISWTCLTQAHLEIFQLCFWPLIAPGYLGEGCHASHQPMMPVPLSVDHCIEFLHVVTSSIFTCGWCACFQSLSIKLMDIFKQAYRKLARMMVEEVCSLICLNIRHWTTLVMESTVYLTYFLVHYVLKTRLHWHYAL